MITLTTDFGYSDHYVGAMKGAIMKVNPHAILVDITHGIRRHDIRHASYVLKAIVDHFPEGTVHLFVVDPGVGTERKAIVAEMDRGYYVGPDNGILTLVSSRVKKVWEIKMEAENPTFHGRDIFAPAAAMVDMRRFDFLEEIKDFVRYEYSEPERDGNVIRCEVIHIDHFGNVITNVPEDMVPDARGFSLLGRKIRRVKTYGEATRGELIALINSENMLEFAVNQGSGERILNIKPGDKIEIEIF